MEKPSLTCQSRSACGGKEQGCRKRNDLGDGQSEPRMQVPVYSFGCWLIMQFDISRNSLRIQGSRPSELEVQISFRILGRRDIPVTPINIRDRVVFCVLFPALQVDVSDVLQEAIGNPATKHKVSFLNVSEEIFDTLTKMNNFLRISYMRTSSFPSSTTPTFPIS